MVARHRPAAWCRGCRRRLPVSVVVTGGAGAVAGPAAAGRAARASRWPASRSRCATSTTWPATPAGWSPPSTPPAPTAPSPTTSRCTSSCRSRRPVVRLARGRRRGGRRRAAPEVPHRRRSRPTASRPPPALAALDRRGARPRDAVQVHRRAAPRGAAPRPRRPASSTTASSTCCWRPAAPSTAPRATTRWPRCSTSATPTTWSPPPAPADLAGARRWFTSFGSCSRHRAARRPDRPGTRSELGAAMTTTWVAGAAGSRLRRRPPAVRRVLRRRRGRPRVGVRHRRRRARPRHRSRRPRCSTCTTSSSDLAERVHGRRPAGLGLDPRLDRRAADRRAERDLVEPHLTRSPRSRCTCRSRSATTSTSTPRSTTPPTSAGSSGPTASRCCPTGGTCRSATTAGPAPSSSPVRRSSGPCGQRKAPTRTPRRTARAAASTSRPSSASWSARGSRAGRAGRRRRLRRPRLRRRRPQRLVGARHPGLGVRAARAVPRQVVRDLDLAVGHAARRARRGLGRPARPGPDAAALPAAPGATPRARHRRRGGAQRRGRQPAAVPHDVLVARPDARPPHRQRRLAAHRRPVRLRHDQRPGARTSAARSSS